MGLHTYQHIFAIFNLPANESDVRLLVERTFEHDHSKVAMRRWQGRFTDFLNEAFSAEAVTDQIGNRNHLELLMFSKLDQIRYARHRAVFLHDFANDTGRCESGDGREIDRCLRLACANQHSAVARSQWKNVARASQIFSFSLWIDCSKDCLRAIERRNSSGDITPRLDGHAERCSIR